MFGNRPRVLRRLPLRDRGGNVTIEAAIMLPVVLTVLLLAADVIGYLDTVARMDRVAATAADLVARSESIVDRTDFTQPKANNDLATFLRAANEVGHPKDLESYGRIWVSVVRPTTGGSFNLLWRRSGPYDLDADSRLDVLPPLPANGNLVVAEVMFRYRPMILDTVAPGIFEPIIYRRAIFRPRVTALAALEPAGDM